jgi:hypothetical protein
MTFPSMIRAVISFLLCLSASLFYAFSLREPVSTSLENAF